MLVPHLKAPCTNDAKYSFSELFYPNACAIHSPCVVNSYKYSNAKTTVLRTFPF